MLLSLPPASATAGTQPARQTGGTLGMELQRLIGPGDAVMVVSPRGTILAAINEKKLLVPASILKLLTSLAALQYLGPDYRFTTEFYLTPANDLVIKGYGDPLLVSEQVAAAAARLAPQLPGLRNIVADATYFDHPIVIPGRNHSPEPYDAPNGALSVNFNTVSFERRDNQWVSGEAQTPLLPSVIPKIEASGLSTGRITMADRTSESALYAADLFAYFLKKQGAVIEGTSTLGQADPEKDHLVFSYRSRFPVTEVIDNLMEFSNNFIANQLMLAMGARNAGPPATVAKGMQALRLYYREVLGIKNGTIAEASGISRKNRVSAQALTVMLKQFAPHHALMRRQGRQWYKTGTLKGIRTRAGYVSASKGGLYTFVVMLNTPGKSTAPVMRCIEKHLK